MELRELQELCDQFQKLEIWRKSYFYHFKACQLWFIMKKDWWIWMYGWMDTCRWMDGRTDECIFSENTMPSLYVCFFFNLEGVFLEIF